jgi:hypothetical protein
VPYESFDGSLIINNDPDNPLACTAAAFVGAPVNAGFGAGGGGGAGSLAITLSGDELLISGSTIVSTIRVGLTGDPGPLNSLGLPETLDGFLGQSASVSGGAGSHGLPVNFSFFGVAGAGVPEPSSLILLATALPLVACALRRRGRVSH